MKDERCFKGVAYGDNPKELEDHAYLIAQDYFGGETELQLDMKYVVNRNTGTSRDDEGRRYWAQVKVYVVSEDHGLDERNYSVQAYGDNPEELATDAIEKAREFFGDEIPLTFNNDYCIRRVTSTSGETGKANGKKFTGSVTVKPWKPATVEVGVSQE